MKLTPALLFVLAAAMAVGCTNTKRTDDGKIALNPSVTDISSTSVAATPAPQPVAYVPPAPAAQPAQPIVYDTMEQTAAAPVDPAPVASARRTSSHTAPRTAHGVSAASATGARYTIKKGDSLWKIAQAKYGDGNRWKKIANANPQIDPNNIKAGQTITIP